MPRILLYIGFYVMALLLGAVVVAVSAGVISISLAHTTTLLVATLWEPVFLLLWPSGTAILALSVAALPNPMHSLLSLITVFFSTVILFLISGAEFLAFTFLIVYVGAIAILFLFVVMLLNIKELISIAQILFSSTSAILTGATILFLTALASSFEHILISTDLLAFAAEPLSLKSLIFFIRWQFMDILLFGDLLYAHYDYLFALIAAGLLTAMLGAIVLSTASSVEYSDRFLHTTTSRVFQTPFPPQSVQMSATPRATPTLHTCFKLYSSSAYNRLFPFFIDARANQIC